MYILVSDFFFLNGPRLLEKLKQGISAQELERCNTQRPPDQVRSLTYPSF